MSEVAVWFVGFLAIIVAGLAFTLIAWFLHAHGEKILQVILLLGVVVGLVLSPWYIGRAIFGHTQVEDQTP